MILKGKGKLIWMKDSNQELLKGPLKRDLMNYNLILIVRIKCWIYLKNKNF